MPWVNIYNVCLIYRVDAFSRFSTATMTMSMEQFMHLLLVEVEYPTGRFIRILDKNNKVVPCQIREIRPDVDAMSESEVSMSTDAMAVATPAPPPTASPNAPPNGSTRLIAQMAALSIHTNCAWCKTSVTSAVTCAKCSCAYCSENCRQADIQLGDHLTSACLKNVNVA